MNANDIAWAIDQGIKSGFSEVIPELKKAIHGDVNQDRLEEAEKNTVSTKYHDEIVMSARTEIVRLERKVDELACNLHESQQREKALEYEIKRYRTQLKVRTNELSARDSETELAQDRIHKAFEWCKTRSKLYVELGDCCVGPAETEELIRILTGYDGRN